MSDIEVIGYGSLLSEASARETVPSLKGFELVRVRGHRRVFNKVGVVFFERFGAVESDLRIASCATQPAPGVVMTCSRFTCSAEDFSAIYEREHRFRWVRAPYETLGGQTGAARMCSENTDENYLLNKCVTAEEYERRVGRFYKGRLWRNDILPFPTYLKHCLAAAATHGEAVRENFLDTTYLADGATTIRAYIANTPDWDAGARAGYSYDD